MARMPSPTASAVVVGAGVFGVFVADALQAAGLAVTLVEAAEPGHDHASSGGHSRVIRSGHGDARGDAYVRSARRAWTLWQQLEERLGERLVHPVGCTWLAATDDGPERQALERLTALGVPAHWLTPEELGAAEARVHPDGLAGALHEPEAGVVRAGPAVAALAADLRRRGVVLRRGVALPDAAGRPVLDGELLDADAVVWATGAWLGRQFPELAPVRAARREYLYVDPPADWRPDASVLIDVAAGVYVLPDVHGAGVKVADDLGPHPLDLDARERPADPEVEARLRAYAAGRMPSLARSPRRGGRVCAYELTPDDGFLAGRHPASPHVWLAGGGSGHGFKHGPAFGADVAAWVLGRGEPPAAFALGARAHAGATLRASPAGAPGRGADGPGTVGPWRT